LDTEAPERQPNSETYRPDGPAVEVREARPRLVVRTPGRAVNPAPQAIPWRVSRDVVLEQLSTDPYELSYAFVLIPRFEQHELKGDLAEDLHALMKQICMSGGWTLDYLSIHLQYMQWIVRSRVNVSSANIVHFVRSRTSSQILENFPLISQTNLSRDFWAPGYLLLVGREPHPPQRVDEFIRLTRQQQRYQNSHRS